MQNLWRLFKRVESEASAEWLNLEGDTTQVELMGTQISKALTGEGWLSPESSSPMLTLLRDYRHDLQLALNGIGTPWLHPETTISDEALRHREINRLKRYNAIVAQIAVLDAELAGFKIQRPSLVHA